MTIARRQKQQAQAKPSPPQAATKAKKQGRAPTPFELRLHKVCTAIPKGKVSTYGALSALLKSSPRAVGQALRRNPYAPQVPCHRVVAASLELGGFSGSWGEDTVEVKRKRAMLVEEGVRFEGSRVKPSCVADPADIATRCVGL